MWINILHLHFFTLQFCRNFYPKRITTIHKSNTDGGVNGAGRQPARQGQSGRGVSLRDTSTLSLQEPGIEPATFRLQVNRLNRLSYCCLRRLSNCEYTVTDGRRPKCIFTPSERRITNHSHGAPAAAASSVVVERPQGAPPH